MKRFDSIFVRRIKEAFSDYNVDHLADEGWNNFIRKKKKRAGIIIPLWAKAASVAVLLTTAGIITYKSFLSIRNPNGKPIVTVVNQETYDAIADDTIMVEKETTLKDIPMAADIIEKKPVLAVKSSAGPYIKKESVENHFSGIHRLPVSLSKLELGVNIKDYLDDKVWQYADFYYTMTDYENPEEGKAKTNLLAGLSGMMARVDNSVSANPATSLGIYLEHSISDRIAFRPGIAITMQGYDLNNGVLKENDVYAAPMVNGMSGSVESYEAQLNFLAMEIPMNIVFTVWERHNSKVFISTGASTMVYLNQKFNGSFINAYTMEKYNDQTGAVTYETNYSEVDVENTYSAFSHVDFFGLANFSAGYSMPFGKSNRLLIEPFIKLPVSDLTSLDLRVLYGGMSLKLRFLE
ncbi:MAG: hypothetical protein JW965_05260 [Bacteroidales bacterium]|nr:hypothetical protein [Bacteroidales bacterium]